MFDVNGRFFRALSKVADLVILNILFLICCIPVFTIGAATTALYGVTKNMAQNRESYIVRSYFKTFKENFKQSTIMWLILLALLGFACLDLYISNYIWKGIGKTLFTGLMTLTIIMVLFVMQYALTLQCTFENTIKNTLKNALFMSIGHLPWSVLITIVSLSPLAVIVALPQYLGVEMMAMFVLWFSAAAYINSFMFNRIYKKYMPKNEKGVEDEAL